MFDTQDCLPILVTKDQTSQNGVLEVDPGNVVSAAEMSGEAPRSADVALISTPGWYRRQLEGLTA